MTLETANAVTQELNRRKLSAELDYPGVIVVGCKGFADEGFLNCGDANATIMADLYHLHPSALGSGEKPFRTLTSKIPSDSSDVQAIADWIARAHQEATNDWF